MIGGIGRHGRTRRDSRNLAAHLLKEQGIAVEIVNSAAPDLRAVMADMELARDGSAADAAFLHIFISPSRNMSRDELRRVGELVLRHFGAEEHQSAFVYHHKPRRGGEGGSHLHLVVGRIGLDGDVLPAGFEIIRMETAMRIAEFEMDEPATLGRHHASAIRWLRANGREDVADWLEATLGYNPDKPASAASPSKRQALARKGVELADVAEVVRSAWSAADGGRSFAAALRAEGIAIVRGEKTNVYIVRHGDVEVGALDRIVKLKRREVAARMEGFEYEHPEDHQPDRRPEDRIPGGPQRDDSRREAGAFATAFGGSAGGAVSDRTAPGSPGDNSDRATPTAPVDAGTASESRCHRVEAARLTGGLKGFSITSNMQREMGATFNRELDELRAPMPGHLRPYLSRPGWGRLRELAKEVRHFVQTVRRKIRFGERRGMPTGTIASQSSPLSRDAETGPVFTIRPK
ncbi:hypothetical protein AAIH70_05555 [Neorhizobium sp. BT27B]|uniref:relaxase/mobilization nuclease domain-containing protein n=1 Tax=Neorhizobium sp. BT27B TaxID=3142625 RepID=UPI003D2D1E01